MKKAHNPAPHRNQALAQHIYPLARPVHDTCLDSKAKKTFVNTLHPL